MAPQSRKKISMVGNEGPIIGCLIHSHEVQRGLGCLCKMFLPSSTLSQKIIIQIGLN